MAERQSENSGWLGCRGCVAAGIVAIVVISPCWADSEFVGPPVPTAQVLGPVASNPVDLNPRPLGRPASRSSVKEPSTKAMVGSAEIAEPSQVQTIWSNPIVRTAGSLAIVLGLILLLAKFGKRMQARGGGLAAAFATGRGPSGILEVLGRYPLARGQTIVLLKFDTRLLLVAQSTALVRGGSSSLQVLTEVRDPEEVAGILSRVQDGKGDSSSARFTSLLSAFDRQHAEPEQGVEQVPFRRVQTGKAGRDVQDRVELWDDRADVVHRFPTIPAAAAASKPRSVSPADVPQSEQPRSATSFTDIRERLHALRGEGYR